MSSKRCQHQLHSFNSYKYSPLISPTIMSLAPDTNKNYASFSPPSGSSPRSPKHQYCSLAFHQLIPSSVFPWKFLQENQLFTITHHRFLQSNLLQQNIPKRKSFVTSMSMSFSSQFFNRLSHHQSRQKFNSQQFPSTLISKSQSRFSIHDLRVQSYSIQSQSSQNGTISSEFSNTQVTSSTNVSNSQSPISTSSFKTRKKKKKRRKKQRFAPRQGKYTRQCLISRESKDCRLMFRVVRMRVQGFPSSDTKEKQLDQQQTEFFVKSGRKKKKIQGNQGIFKVFFSEYVGSELQEKDDPHRENDVEFSATSVPVSVSANPPSKVIGRSIYLTKSVETIKTAMKGDRLSKVFKSRVDPVIYQQLLQAAEQYEQEQCKKLDFNRSDYSSLPLQIGVTTDGQQLLEGKSENNHDAGDDGGHGDERVKNCNVMSYSGISHSNTDQKFFSTVTNKALTRDYDDSSPESEYLSKGLPFTLDSLQDQQSQNEKMSSSLDESFTRSRENPPKDISDAKCNPQKSRSGVNPFKANKRNSKDTQEKDSKERCPWVDLSKPDYVHYHDTEWGVPVHDDKKLFEFLVLESAQAGLSWYTILQKREKYRKAFVDFDFNKVAKFGDSEVEDLMNNPEIVRNRAKILAAINNARKFIEIREEYGSFAEYQWAFVDNKSIQNQFKTLADIPSKTELSDILAKDLKNRGFKFLGSTTVYSYMQAVGMTNDHTVDCFRHAELCLGD